jgi:hypothetical protein
VNRTTEAPVDAMATALAKLRVRSRRCLAEMTRLTQEIEDLHRQIDANATGTSTTAPQADTRPVHQID